MKNFVGYTLKVSFITFGGFYPKVPKRNNKDNQPLIIKGQLERLR